MLVLVLMIFSTRNYHLDPNSYLVWCRFNFQGSLHDRLLVEISLIDQIWEGTQGNESHTPHRGSHRHSIPFQIYLLRKNIPSQWKIVVNQYVFKKDYSPKI